MNFIKEGSRTSSQDRGKDLQGGIEQRPLRDTEHEETQRDDEKGDLRLEEHRAQGQERCGAQQAETRVAQGDLRRYPAPSVQEEDERANHTTWWIAIGEPREVREKFVWH